MNSPMALQSSTTVCFSLLSCRLLSTLFLFELASRGFKFGTAKLGVRLRLGRIGHPDEFLGVMCAAGMVSRRRWTHPCKIPNSRMRTVFCPRRQTMVITFQLGDLVEIHNMVWEMLALVGVRSNELTKPGPCHPRSEDLTMFIHRPSQHGFPTLNI